jgi:hypothetical protein
LRLEGDNRGTEGQEDVGFETDVRPNVKDEIIGCDEAGKELKSGTVSTKLEEEPGGSVVSVHYSDVSRQRSKTTVTQ